jgi:AraC-like DNA-binding protein
LAADPNPITPNAAGPFVPSAAVSDLPELLCRICSERRLLPEESCAVCPFRSAPATAPSAERSGEPSGDPFPSPPDPVNPVEPAADPAQAQSRLERAILGGTLVEIRDRLACRSCCAAAWELIRTRFADADLTLGRAARACGVSPRNLNRRLRERVGWSFHRLLTRYRVLVAAERMLKNDDTLVRIAQATGFNHVSSLSRHFRKVTGCVPRAFSRPVR